LQITQALQHYSLEKGLRNYPMLMKQALQHRPDIKALMKQAFQHYSTLMKQAAECRSWYENT
jgi:hypothetical protein